MTGDIDRRTLLAHALSIVSVRALRSRSLSAQTADRREPSLVVDPMLEYGAAAGMPAFAAPADSLVSQLTALWSLPREASQTAGRVVVAADCLPQTGLRNPSLTEPSASAALNTAALNAVAALETVPLALGAYPVANRQRLVVTFYYNQLSAPGPVSPPVGWPPSDAFRPGGAVTPAKAVLEARPVHSRLAAQAGIRGRVVVEAVVRSDGTVVDAIVVQSLDRTFGLDLAAIDAIKQWRFAPGTRMGQPVAVVMTIELPFTPR